ncbi:MAG: manganese efflux pump [Clostridiales bacterium]|jgi:putative Mn2+ efflux pump MntP|nr:manganese efflux pump [Clostridiales bacterium]
MGFIEITLIAVSLAMDAFAVSISKGLEMRRVILKSALLIAVCFGCFQAGMPILGWMFGLQLERYVMNYGHWAAFILLFAIGGKMIFDVVRGDTDKNYYEGINIRKLIILSIATSIDAFAVGVSLAFLGSSVFSAALVIGIITFVLSFAGVLLGNGCKNKFSDKAGMFGGIILILIGLRILLKHFGCSAD